MSEAKTEADHIAMARAAILETVGFHVTFDGWSEAMLKVAAHEAGVEPGLVKQAFPRGVIDVAVAFHMAGDATLAERLAAQDLSAIRYSERVGFAVMERLRIATPDREAVRRATAFFALPVHAASGSKCVWHTADTIWTALGDTSDDLNWYSKRTILSGVYSASLMFWLGDESEDFEATQAFVDRRIADVMRFEQVKARVKSSKLYEAFKSGPGRFLDRIKAPGSAPPRDLPGYWGK